MYFERVIMKVRRKATFTKETGRGARVLIAHIYTAKYYIS
jgi:hypothetical protein